MNLIRLTDLKHRKMKRACKALSQVRKREAFGDTGAGDSCTMGVGADIVCHATTVVVDAGHIDVMLAFVVNRFRI